MEADIYLGNVKRSSSNVSIFDETEYNNIVSAINQSAELLGIPDATFDNAERANGTDTMEYMDNLWLQVQEMTNRYKIFMNIDVISLLTAATENIKAADEMAAESVSQAQ
ncbi:hypothetical protein [Pseudobutyrivibrio ruminis]|uniref:Uncharacterized protein n=2 Tax=Pseudobutyrivibrio ruminis TaxID=46206 RepID=A0A2G3DS96_9FIRM|nr:hypothetical protein [Pseudobutyrivibrio ruminis]PHU33912.1 hypothetical protein CSX01_12285 [Pseudobutyrivibrio ruminis]